MLTARALAFFLVPVDDSALLELIKPHQLVPLPSADFPNGYPAGKHPLLVWTGMENDIRQTIAGIPAYISGLVSSSVIVPYVDVLGDGKSPFEIGVKGFMGGVNGQDLQGLVPSLVGTLADGGYPLVTSHLDPNTAAYQPLPHDLFYQNTYEELVPQLVSGPGVYPSAIDTQFSDTAAPLVPFRTIKKVLNQPILLPAGQCQRNGYWFNETFADPIPRTGQVTLYAQSLPSQLAGTGAVTYKDSVTAWSADGQVIGFLSESCANATKNVFVP